LGGLNQYLRAIKGARNYRLRPYLCGGAQQIHDLTASGQLTTWTLPARYHGWRHSPSWMLAFSTLEYMTNVTAVM